MLLRYITEATLVIVLCVYIQSSHEKKTKNPMCPIGFSLAYTKDDADPICYRRKGPETYTEKYKDCSNNLYTTGLYQKLNISKPDYTVWTDYKTFYPGGLFVDWSYTNSFGNELNSSYDITFDPNLDLDEELCVVIDPINSFTAVKCYEKHYRYCFVAPYDDDLKMDGCEYLKDGFRFESPEPTCLTILIGVGGGAVRATWTQAQDLCTKKGGSLLNRGWRYANNPLFHNSEISKTYPLGIVMSTDYSLLRYDAIDDHSEIPTSEWNFAENDKNADTLLGGLRDSLWFLVNSSYIFYDVICERSIQRRNISLEVAIDLDNKLTLTVNNLADDENLIKDIICLTDSVVRYPTMIKKRRKYKTNVFILKPEQDGYYWCIYKNTKSDGIIKSNKVLFIREKQSVINVYAVQFRQKEKYRLENLDTMRKVWEMKLGKYIYYKTKYESVYGEINTNVGEEEIKKFQMSNTGLEWKEKTVIRKMKIKRLYLDAQDVLVHIEMNPDTKPVSPGTWEGLEIVSMKPAYFCKGFNLVRLATLGESVDSVGCRTHSCVGNFNEGVQWVTTITDDCSTRIPTTLDSILRFGVSAYEPTLREATNHGPNRHDSTSESSEETEEITNTTTAMPNGTLATTEAPSTEIDLNTTKKYTTIITPTVTVIDTSTVNPPVETTTPKVTPKPTSPPPPPPPPTTPTTLPPTTTPPNTPRPPEEQLQQVLDDLDRLVNNETTPVHVQDISEVFDQVDALLEDNDELEIPGQLLHLLDQLGSSIDLNGTSNAYAVRPNIALLMADAQPDHPIRGFRLVSTSADVFSTSDFEFISQEPNSTVLSSDESEVVVHLPVSVSESQRRVSFVVFRNDRAFPEETYSVNSRVLSVKIENLTTFDHGEVIDIHLSPLVSAPDRNTSRSCAYWQFLEDGSGYWSQEGCTFIRSTREGILDICRCDHLTHFAEVLVPKTVFSERNEYVLGIISIVGCFISMFGLILVGVTATVFRTWRREYSNKIWLQLCAAIFIVAINFTIVFFAKFDHYNVGCMLVGIALHYSVLASFCWMLVAAVLSYRRLVLVFARDASHKLLKASAFAWGAPCAVVGVLLSVAPHSYAGRFEEMTPSGSFCYPSDLSLWLTVYAPIALVLLVNWTLFALIVRSVFASRRIQRHGDSNEAIRCASVSCLLVFLFGLPWVFGLFAYNIVAAYIFSFLATYQGFILFFFFVLGNKKTRDMWLNKLKIKQTRKIPVTSSTYSNRSTGWRPGNQTVTLEAKASKPKSLSSHDESRFS